MEDGLTDVQLDGFPPDEQVIGLKIDSDLVAVNRVHPRNEALDVGCEFGRVVCFQNFREISLVV